MKPNALALPHNCVCLASVLAPCMLPWGVSEERDAMRMAIVPPSKNGVTLTAGWGGVLVGSGSTRGLF